MDITGLVRGWINGSIANYGVTLRGPESSGDSSAMLMLYTRESSSHDPYLRIEYAGMAAFEEATPRVEEILTLKDGPTILDLFGDSLCAPDYGVFEFINQPVCSPD